MMRMKMVGISRKSGRARTAAATDKWLERKRKAWPKCWSPRKCRNWLPTRLPLIQAHPHLIQNSSKVTDEGRTYQCDNPGWWYSSFHPIEMCVVGQPLNSRESLAHKISTSKNHIFPHKMDFIAFMCFTKNCEYFHKKVLFAFSPLIDHHFLFCVCFKLLINEFNSAYNFGQF